MKILCLVLDTDDHKWLVPFWEQRSTADDIVVVAPTFDGRLLVDSIGIPFKVCDDIAWNLDKLEINNESRIKSGQWHKLAELDDNFPLRAIKTYGGYPLFEMHQAPTLLALQEIIQAHRFIHALLEIEQPDSVLYGDRDNPFLCHPISYITGSSGVEREVVKALLSSNCRAAKNYRDFAATLAPRLPEISVPAAHSGFFCWPPELDGARILIFAWGDYYLEYFENVIEQLLVNRAKIGVVITGGQLPEQTEQNWHNRGICVLKKSAWMINNQEAIWAAWSAKCERAAESLYDNPALIRYFADDYGSYYPGLVSDVLCKQIMDTPATVIELLRSEAIIREFAPDMVLSHFCIHPLETCDVLPARLLGIPTLAIDHGVHGYNDTQRVTFATEYYGVTGRTFQEAINMAVDTPLVALPVIGNLRYDKVKPRSGNTREIKLRYGFDPDRPLCIFCDSSGWSHMGEWRHSTYSTVEAVLSLKRHFPELQIIYRVHHGANYKAMSAFFNNLGSHDILFQISPDPPLLDILPAADLVVSHCTSAVSEALLSGVPVVYLTARGEPEPSFFGCAAISIAESFAMLPGVVAEVLDAALSPVKVRQLAQPYFDMSLAGHDGKASERLAGLILELAALPRSERKHGFQDWLGRIEVSCKFDARQFRKLISTRRSVCGHKEPFVSIIIPTYNRAKMIGITLESFVKLDYPRDRYEIIVADNNSSDNTKVVIRQWQRQSHVPIHYFHEGRQGAHFARNSAAIEAKGEILYFTDDDMIAEPGLLGELVKIFASDPLVGTATGRVVPKWEVEPPGWILELCNNSYLSLNDLGEESIISGHDIGVFSCHQAVIREVFFRAGGFNPDFFGTELLGDGETGLNIKLRDFGYKFGYNGKSVIHHMIPASRMTQDYLNKRLANQGSADCYTEYKKHRFSSEQLADRVQGYVSSLIEKSSLCVDKRLNDDVRWRMEKAYSHYYLSRIEYDLRLMKDPDWRELVLKDDWINE